MKVVEQSHEILKISENSLEQIEEVARTCYQSHDKTREGSAKILVQNLVSRKHGAMLEFADMTVRFVTNRGVSHELVRHRLCSFAQESTRYVKYDGDMEFIKPVWWENCTKEQQDSWRQAMCYAEHKYKELLSMGWKAQHAREVLPNALKTEINVKANLREWQQIFFLRCASAAHPQMVALMQPLLKKVQRIVPIIFDHLPID